MEYRTQTYLGALQVLLIVTGTLVVSVALKNLEEMLYNPEAAPLGTARAIAGFGAWLLIIPLVWVVVTIRAERSSVWWASGGLTWLTGTVILLGLGCTFGWALVRMASLVFG